MDAFNYVLDLNNPPPELQEKVKALIADAGGELNALVKQVGELIETLTRGHEQTQEALQTPAKYRAFVESLTAEDLRGEGATEDSIRDFLNASIEEKTEAVDLLDIFTVYRLYEKKDAEGAIKVPATATADGTGYKGLEQLKRGLLQSLREQSTGSSSEGLQGIKTLRRSELAKALEQRQDEAQSLTINIELTE